jgi:cob(I)alamin adenosyltransferase
MANRLTKIVTRTGDDGTTGLGDGTRVKKDSPRVWAMGEIDELASAIGCVLAEDVPANVRAALAAVQNDLFDLGGEICIPGRSALWDVHVQELERRIEALREPLPALKEFVLPGGPAPPRRAISRAPSAAARSDRSWLWAASKASPSSASAT